MKPVEKQKNQSEYFILQLLITDLLYVVSMPFWIYSAFTEFFWPFGLIVCKFASGIFCLGMYSMTFFVAALSIDRFIILFAPRLCRNFTCNVSLAKRSSVILWLFAFICSLPDFTTSIIDEIPIPAEIGTGNGQC